ncbi:heme anaerobic degradation radical SAM methyltransferase ChuW/HutW [Afifella sp. YEN Y35]|uniref:heme anaerobic degradation radical SAM methyltransferase ChuW/HutW n=1 Tax=Afifella sp. YEN Y35 TaxID=3388337 RepID=UPI0039E19DCF
MESVQITAPAARRMQEFFAAEDGTPLRNAFGAKRVVHPSFGAQMVPEESREATWRELTRRPRARNGVAYLHVPFCENHCLFCGFYQNAWRPEAGPAYVDALIAHLKRDAGLPYQAEGALDAVYFGGGTPTVLSAPDLARLITAVRTYLPLAPDCEITVEGRPRSFDDDKIAAIFDAGANRVSLGVQTFDTRLRRSLGRRASREELIAFLDRLVKADGGAIVVDLIYGLPGQTLEAFRNDVETAIAIGLDGADVYSLKLIPHAPLRAAIDKGKFPPMDRAEFGLFYAEASEVFERAGWHSISTTHWRQGERERNIYNHAVKSGAECLAFGAGAGGSLGGYSYGIGDDLRAYQEAISAGHCVVGRLTRQPENHDLFSLIKSEMELGRLNVAWLSAQLERRAGLQGDVVLAPLFAQWQRAGLVEADKSRLRLTLAGRFWQVTLTQNLLEWLQAQLCEAETAGG